MRRFSFVLLTLASVSGCALRQTTGEQSLSFTVPTSADTVLARAKTQLRELGYELAPNEDRLVITTPRPIPDSLTQVADGTTLTGKMWILRVTAAEQPYSAGARATVTAFVFPAPARDQSPGNVVYEQATPVTRSSTPALFSEVQRVAERIQEAAARPAPR